MSAQGKTAEYRLSKSYSYYIFTLLFLLYLFDYMDRLVVTSLFPYIKEAWGLTDAQCGMTVSAVYWSIVAFTFPVSLLVDRWSRKKTIALMALVWSLGTAACALARNFKELFIARGVIGVGEAGYAPGGTAMLAGIFPQEQRARIVGIWQASIPLGSALGIAIGGIVAEHWGWRHAFGLVAFPGIIVGIMFFFVKDYKTVRLEKDEGPAARKMSRGDIVRQFTRTPSLILTYTGFAFCAFVTTALLTWLPTYFHRIEGISISQAGVKTGLIMMLAIVGAPVGGYLTDAWYRKNPRARLFFGCVTNVLCAVLLFASFTLVRGPAQFVMFLFVGALIVAFSPGVIAVTQDVVHPGLRAISYAIAVIVQNLLGASTAPIVIGAFSDSFGIESALKVLPVFLVIATLLFFAGAFYYERDLAKVDRVTLEMED